MNAAATKGLANFLDILINKFFDSEEFKNMIEKWTEELKDISEDKDNVKDNQKRKRLYRKINKEFIRQAKLMVDNGLFSKKMFNEADVTNNFLQQGLKLDKKFEGIVYSGRTVAKTKRFKVNSTFNLQSTLRTSESRDDAEDYLPKPTKIMKPVLYIIKLEGIYGVSTKEASYYDEEDEVTLPKGAKLKVVKVTKEPPADEDEIKNVFNENSKVRRDSNDEKKTEAKPGVTYVYLQEV